MRKHIAAALAFIIALSAFALPPTAYASDTASMELSITLTEDDVTPPPDEPEEETPPPSEPTDEQETSGPDFVIYIPASISLNEQSDIRFDWTNYNLVKGDEVRMYIDGAKTFPDGTFYLITGNGSTEYQRIACDIKCFTAPFAPDYFEVNGPEDVEIAAYIIGTNTKYPYATSGGRLSFDPKYYLSPKVPGTYTGTIHFKIEVKH